MNISVIIPIHEFNDELSPLVTKAIDSVEKMVLPEGETAPVILLVYPTELDEAIVGLRDSMIRKHETLTHESFVLIKNDGNTNYQAQVNLGVEAVTTDYFTVLEFDDELADTFIKNATIYTKAYPEIDVFLTMMVEVNEENQAVKFANETVWAQQFVGENGEMGYLNSNALKQYTDFKLSGAVIKKSDFQNLGGYKTNIKLTFMYEYLLRALNNASKIFTIPKMGYKHFATRAGSLFNGYQQNMSVEERKFWFETATKESNFPNDRPIDLSKLQKVAVQ